MKLPLPTDPIKRTEAMVRLARGETIRVRVGDQEYTIRPSQEDEAEVRLVRKHEWLCDFCQGAGWFCTKCAEPGGACKCEERLKKALIEARDECIVPLPDDEARDG